MFEFSTAADDRQRLFDNAWNGFVEQNWAYSMNASRRGCVYRDPEGHKCAIGWSLPDNLYNKKLDVKSGEKIGEVLKLSGFPDDAMFHEFARHLQDVHDSAANDMTTGRKLSLSLEVFKGRMRNFAKVYKLTVPE